MRLKRIVVNTELEACDYFARFAKRYMNDVVTLAWHILENSYWNEYGYRFILDTVWPYVQDKYVIDPGPDEIVVRPRIFMTRGGDCTNQAIFFMALLAVVYDLTRRPLKKTELVIARGPYDSHAGHIFLSYNDVSYSALPDEVFNNWNWIEMRRYDVREVLG